MTRRLTAKVGEYEKDGQTKGRYVDLGVILSNDNGEFALLDPAVNLAGVLTQQNMMNHKNGKKPSDRVMVSIFVKDQHRQEYDSRDSGGGFEDDIPTPGAMGYSGRKYDDEIPF